MIQVMITAPSSGSGKTMVTCALIRALQNRGIRTAAFKSGPDYIDPMFHRRILGAAGHNLDLFLSGPETVRSLYANGCRGKGAAVCEGVMGYYDGAGGTTDASSWHVADTLGISSLLVIRPGGAGLTLAAEINGLNSFRRPSRIKGILLNDCSPMLATTLERETGIPVMGCMPHLPDAVVKSRHLGLYTADEIGDLDIKISRLAQCLENNSDLDRLIELFDSPAPDVCEHVSKKPYICRIAMAADEAFCFTYSETREALENAGAEIVTFSPLRDEKLPGNIGGLYLPGGYPELYAEALSGNTAMREEILRAVKGGLPTVAECGGYLYLCLSLEDGSGNSYPMVGALPGAGFRTEKLTRFGYAKMTARDDSLLFKKGESVPVHEFHYWDSTDNGDAFSLTKPVSGRNWQGGHASPSLYAGFPHLYFMGNTKIAERFVDAAKEAQK